MRVFNTSFIRQGTRLAAALGLALAVFCPAGAFAIDQFAPDAYGTYKADAENGKVLFGAAGCGAAGSVGAGATAGRGAGGAALAGAGGAA